MSGLSPSSRVTIADVARHAGVSVSTVDRVLNGRAPVRTDTAERIQVAAESLGFRAVGILRERFREVRPKCTLGFLLQEPKSAFYRSLARELDDATEGEASIKGQAIVHHMDDISPEAVSKCMRELGERVDALAITAADHPLIASAVEYLAARGVPVFSLISDLSAPLRAGYAGLDNRRKGRTAAWFVTRLAKEPGPVAIFVGSHRIHCQELCEMSFRSYMREHAPEFEVLEPVVTMESEQVAMESMRNILRRHPDLVGFYVAGSGVEGVLSALEAEGVPIAAGMVGVGHEFTPGTRNGLLSGRLQAVLSHPLEEVSRKLVTCMANRITQKEPGFQQVVVPFTTHTPESA